MTDSGDQYFSKTLDKGLRVLALFNEQNPVHSQTEISKILGLNMTSTFRLINTLVQLGYLQKDKETKKLRLGLTSLALAATHLRTFDVHRVIRSLVDDVHEKYQVTVDVALVVDDALMIVYRREAEGTLTYRLPSVNRSWHTTSLGKAYLAFLDARTREEKINQLSLEPKTANSIVTRDRLLTELDESRQRGYAISNEEFLAGLITMGAPLLSPETGLAIGAVSFDFLTIQQTVGTMTRGFSQPLLTLARDLSQVITAV
jgi:DNA-binding IclR family transcriptional regulator